MNFIANFLFTYNRLFISIFWYNWGVLILDVQSSCFSANSASFSGVHLSLLYKRFSAYDLNYNFFKSIFYKVRMLSMLKFFIHKLSMNKCN